MDFCDFSCSDGSAFTYPYIRCGTVCGIGVCDVCGNLENEFRTAVIISGICAVVMGAIGGRNFTEITLFYAYSSIIVFAARKRPRYVGNFPKTIVWTFIMSAILEILLFVIREMTFDVSVIFSDALPTAVFNTVIAVILYPILKKTLYKEEKKKKLLIA